MVGLYASTFYLMTNITLLPARSAFLIALVLIAPVVMVAVIVNILLSRYKGGKLARVISIFLSAIYLMLIMRVPILDTDFVNNYLIQIGSSASTVVKILYCVLPAAVFAVVFHHDIRKFSFVLGIMTLASIFMNITSAVNNLGINETYSKSAKNLNDITLSKKSNIYLILADGYASFAYMNENGIDVSGFKTYLRESGFRLYDEVFSNYHPTTAAMPAMLHMNHHYYTLSEKFSEVTKTGRVIAGGENNLVQLLKRNDYQTHYVHQTTYLVAHGCTADHCYPKVHFPGAKVFLKRIFPTFVKIEEDNQWDWVRSEVVRDEVVSLIEMDTAPSRPHFQYIHLYAPMHSENKVEDICNEVEEVQKYSTRVGEVNVFLPSLIDNIISRDPTAVIVIVGDHGPFITHNCSRNADLSTLREYRDRVGVVMAIRWPESYDGIYDDRLKTTINLFRYVLASLVDNDTDILETLVPDDVYIRGKRILKVLQDGKILIPPEHYAEDALQ